ncbi:ABC-2 transporter permease [Thomasclavelia sp.]|uniref:ABC-2 transporter permease n=1 Tax=Thomasclavelia sp. TaxID=3025757 RepID=UPI0025D5059C|nr:ABC-2 transporter permease [Thomasclavelia sp.]
MKGLLIKDFKLMLKQKNYFIIIILIAIALAGAFDYNPFFIMGYLVFIAALFSISTISYDEFDNGNAFLFTLPFKRNNYVSEKYYFGIIMGLAAWLISLLVITVFQLYNGSYIGLNTLILPALMLIPVMLTILSIMIPIHLKFGNEKGRIVNIVFVGGVFIIGYLAVTITNAFHLDLSFFMPPFKTIIASIGIDNFILIITMLLGILITIISYKISCHIINNKEF